MKWVIGASAFGTALDWYDFLIYGALASVLAENFFPSQNVYLGVMSTLAVFGVGFVGRPLGGIIFGRMGDIVGRQKTFVITMILMGASTVCMGLLPTYRSVGMLAPALLTALRLTQGISLGGETGGAATYVAEFSPDNRRGFNTSLSVGITSDLGALMGSIVIFVLSNVLGNVGVASYGWRIAFLFSLVLLVGGVYMRVKLSETPLFQELREAHKLSKKPVSETIKMNWKQMLLLVVGLQGGMSVVSWSAGLTGPLMFMSTIMTPRIELGLASALATIGSLIALPVPVLTARLSDRIGARKMIQCTGILATGILVIPCYYLIGYGGRIGNVGLMVAGVVIMMVAGRTGVGPLYALYAELFPTRTRYTSLAFSLALSIAIFGGFTPFIVTAITNAAGGQFFIGLLWVVGVAIISPIIGIIFVKETHCKLAT
jgi:MFS family permease